jgi:predicted molibdopterin-dependent oxidoreductase YjgC
MVFATFHFHEVPVNRLTSDALDPEGKIPELKFCAVRLEKVAEGQARVPAEVLEQRVARGGLSAR